MNEKEMITRTKRSCIQRETAHGTTGMVVTAHPFASEIGELVLKNGGNAVDAVVAIQFALNVAEPMNTGIGGSGFMMVYNEATKTTKIFDGHTQAPKAAYPEMFLDDNDEVIPFKERSTHATAIGIPGILKAMDAALQEFGSKPLSQLIEPAALAAEKGIDVNWVMHETLELFHYRLGDEAKGLFFPEGKGLKEGDKLVKEHLAKTFRILQKDGIKAFYEGEIAEAIVNEVRKHGGFMTIEDLMSYEHIEDEPVWGEYRGYKIASSAPPSAGGPILLHILKILEEYDLKKYGPRSWEKYYLFTEAMRLAFSDKIAFLGDPRFLEMPLLGLLDERYVAERRALINFTHMNNEVDFGNPWKFEGKEQVKVVRQPYEEHRGETTHFTVRDRWGNIAACTSTVEHPFGSGIMVPGYGILLNNELTDFDAVPGGVNEAGPGKRPVSCKTPTIVFNNEKPVLTLGSPGGPTIIASVFQTLVNVIDFGMDLKAAIEEPRIFATPGPLISWELGMDMESKGKLESMGYQFADVNHVIGNVQAIKIGEDELYGAADSSREGTAIGMSN